MKKSVITLLMLLALNVQAQVGIGQNRFTPDASSILELRSDSKGLLIPRLTSSQKDLMTSLSDGLLIYQIDNEPGFYFYNGSSWEALISLSKVPVADFQNLSFDNSNFVLSLQNGGTVDLSILKNGRTIESTIDNGDGTLTFNFSDGSFFTTGSLYGPQGLKGDSGTNGLDGLSLRSGTGSPDASLGNEGDHYIDYSNGMLYGPKTNGAWPASISLVGPSGTDGTDGIDGINGTNGLNGKNGADGSTLLSGNGTPANTLGKDGDHYIDTSNGMLYGPKASGVWSAALSLIGPSGTNGTNGKDGVNGKDGSNGLNGTNGIDGTNGKDGADGLDGVDGLSLRSGVGLPANSLGNDGDHYIDSVNGLLYGPKSGGVWPAPTSLIGPAGSDGMDGTNGVDGKDGANGVDGIDGIDGANGLDGIDGLSLRSGNGVPSNALGNDGDHYIDSANGLLYGPKTAGSWPAPTSLIGPAGSDGSNGSNGTNGTDGKDGTDGLSLRSGSGAPSNASGNDGDHYIDSTNGMLYGPKSGGVWPAPISLIGPAGTNGINGTDGKDGTNGADGADGLNGTNGIDGTNGNTILSGNTNPTAATGVDGDFYLNLNSLELFGPKSSGAWPSSVSLVGTGISSTLDNPDGSITFNYSDGSSFTSQPDGDFDDSNELISSISLSNKTLQITENGNSKSVDLSPALKSTLIEDQDANTSVETDLSNGNENIIRFKLNGTERWSMNNKTIEVTNAGGSVLIGESTGLDVTGSGNTFIGSESGNKTTSGRFNVALGYRALRQNTTGQGNVAIGYNAGFNETGSNKLYIDNSNTNKPLLYGDFSSDLVNVNGKLGVGISNPSAIADELEVNGSAVVISLTQTSDKRLKKNVHLIESPVHLLKQIEGVSYEWRQEEFPNRKFKAGRKLGFLAQDVQKVFPELVSQGSGGYYSVSYAGFTPVLVEAIKEQQSTIEALNQKVADLEEKLNKIIEQLETEDQND